MEAPDRATLEAWDDAHVWHPFTPHTVYRAEAPLMVVAAEGHELIDVDGRRYLDGVGSLWCNILGHRRPELDAAVREQLERVAHATFLGNAGVPGVVLAKRLADLAPDPLTRVFYSDSGSTAVEQRKIGPLWWGLAASPSMCNVRGSSANSTPDCDVTSAMSSAPTPPTKVRCENRATQSSTGKSRLAARRNRLRFTTSHPYAPAQTSRAVQVSHPSARRKTA